MTLSAPIPQNGHLTQTIRRQFSDDCLSVFDHFVKLALQGLKTKLFKLKISQNCRIYKFHVLLVSQTQMIPKIIKVQIKGYESQQGPNSGPD